MSLKHGSLENLILNVIWDNSELAEEPLCVSQVQDCLNRLNMRKKWAYTTVKTILDRLSDKGLLQKIKSGKKYDYKCILQREQMARTALQRVALDFFKNDLKEMTTFVNNMLSEEENTQIYAQR